MPIFRKPTQSTAPFATAPPDEAADIPATREELAVLNDPQSVIAEQYRRLRNSILTLNPDRASRTILMTSATTVLAMIPMAIGLGSGEQLQRPLAITIIGGLSLTTVLTLFYTPLLYQVAHRIARPGPEPTGAGEA